MTEEKSVLALHTIPGPIELAKKAWLVYKERFWSLIGIGALGIVITFLLILVVAILGIVSYVGLGSKLTPASVSIESILVLILLVGISLIWSWTGAASILSVSKWQESYGIRAALGQAKKFIIPIFLGALLLFVINLGAFFFFIIPAFIFSIWFSFWQYFVVLEGKSPFASLSVSREIVRGRFWGIFWRIIAIHLPELLISILLGRMSHSGSGPAQGALQLLSIALQPFYFSYMYLLFVESRKSAKELPQAPTRGNKLAYIIIPLLGYIIIIVTSIMVIPRVIQMITSLSAGIPGNELQSGGSSIAPSTGIVYGLTTYYLANKKFPESLQVLVENHILTTIPRDTKTGLPYRYSVESNGQDFKLCTPVSVKPEKCVTSASKDFDL